MSTRTPFIGVDLPDVTVIVYYDVDLRPDMSDHVDSFYRRLTLMRDLRVVRFYSDLLFSCSCSMCAWVLYVNK